MVDKPTRRAVLRTVGATTTGNLLTGNVVGGAGNNIRVITTRGGPNHEPRATTKVPRRWREAEIGVEDAVSDVFNYVQNEGFDFVLSVSSRITDNQIAGRNSSRVCITVDEAASDAKHEKLPDSIEDVGVNSSHGVPTNIIINEEPDDAGPVSCEGFKTATTFKAGWRVMSPENSDGVRERGTAGFPLHDGTEQYMLTANHVLTPKSTCYDGIEGYDWDENFIGPKDQVQQDHDWGAIGLNNNSYPDSFADEIWYDGGKTATVVGVKSDDGVRDLKSNSTIINSQGCVTGLTEGTITDNNTFFIQGCYAGDGNDIKSKGTSDQYVAKGDSGGPIFTIDSNGDAHAITINARGQDKAGDHSCGNTQAYSKNHGYSIEAIINNNSYTIGAK